MAGAPTGAPVIVAGFDVVSFSSTRFSIPFVEPATIVLPAVWDAFHVGDVGLNRVGVPPALAIRKTRPTPAPPGPAPATPNAVRIGFVGVMPLPTTTGQPVRPFHVAPADSN